MDASSCHNRCKFCDEFGYEYIPIHMIQVRNQSKSALNGKPKSKCAHEPLTFGMSKCLCVAKNGKVMHKKKNLRPNQESESQVAHDCRQKL